jgi:hypothetical protein
MFFTGLAYVLGCVALGILAHVARERFGFWPSALPRAATGYAVIRAIDWILHVDQFGLKK